MASIFTIAAAGALNESRVERPRRGRAGVSGVTGIGGLTESERIVPLGDGMRFVGVMPDRTAPGIAFLAQMAHNATA